MDRKQAMDLIRRHGVVLEAARGLEPALADRIAGEEIRGGWWSHPRGHEIYELTQRVRDSRAVLVCTLAKGRITYIHRRLWPSFVRLASKFPEHSLDQVREFHIPSGRHRRDDIPFPRWVPADVMRAAQAMPIGQASDEIHTWLSRYGLVQNTR